MAGPKSSEKEEEFFARQDLERLRALAQQRRAQAEAEELEKRKQLHYMHCPKCGDDLDEITYMSIKVDKCPSCEGSWLDGGELEAILQNKDAKLMGRILKVFKK